MFKRNVLFAMLLALLMLAGCGRGAAVSQPSQAPADVAASTPTSVPTPEPTPEPTPVPTPAFTPGFTDVTVEGTVISGCYVPEADIAEAVLNLACTLTEKDYGEGVALELGDLEAGKEYSFSVDAQVLQQTGNFSLYLEGLGSVSSGPGVDEQFWSVFAADGSFTLGVVSGEMLIDSYEVGQL